MFKQANREQLKARIALDGPSGSGKTYTGLRFAFALGQRVAVIDSEHRSASKYVGECPDNVPWNFDTCNLRHFAPTAYTQVIKEAGAAGYDVVLIDSLSHAWEGVGGALDQVGKQDGNSFTAWKNVTPQHREMIEAILASPCHIIATMRTKTEYVLEEQTNKQGRSVMVPRKVGMAPVQRAGMEYEFDIVCDLDVGHQLTVSKTRCPAIDGKIVVKPDAGFMSPVRSWLERGTAPAPVEAVFESTEPANQPAGRGIDLGGIQEPGTEASVHAPCGSELADQIKAVAKEVGLPIEKLKEILDRHHAQTLAEMPFTHANELLQKLKAKRLEKANVF